MVREARRPLAERVEDIGAWYGILRGVTYVAVVSNVRIRNNKSSRFKLANYITKSNNNLLVSYTGVRHRIHVRFYPPQRLCYRLLSHGGSSGLY